MNPGSGMNGFVKLLVTDVSRARGFYSALGFELVFADPLFTHLRWAPNADLFLVSAPPGHARSDKPGAGVLICFTTGAPLGREDVDAIAQKALAAGATCDGPRGTPWHTRELIVVDPEGYRVNFVQPA